MLNSEQFEKLSDLNLQQSTINKEMVEIARGQLEILETINKDVYTKLYGYKDQAIPAELTNTFITSFSKLFNYYDLFLTLYREKLSTQFDLTNESMKILNEGYEQIIRDIENS